MNTAHEKMMSELRASWINYRNIGGKLTYKEFAASAGVRV